MRGWPLANISTYFFLGSDKKNIISCEKKISWLVKLYFSPKFINDFIPLDPDPDPKSESGSTNPNESGSGFRSGSTSLVIRESWEKD